MGAPFAELSSLILLNDVKVARRLTRHRYPAAQVQRESLRTPAARSRSKEFRATQRGDRSRQHIASCTGADNHAREETQIVVNCQAAKLTDLIIPSQKGFRNSDQGIPRGRDLGYSTSSEPAFDAKPGLSTEGWLRKVPVQTSSNGGVAKATPDRETKARDLRARHPAQSQFLA